MTRKYVIGTSALTPVQEKELIAYLKESKVGWWHWIKGMWLVVDPRDQLSPKLIRDKLRGISGTGRFLVIEVDGRTNWAGSGAKVGDKNMFSWLRERWNKQRSDGNEAES